MKLTYLGTAAAEGWPAVFCNCEYCLKAKKAGGKNIRTRSQAIIDNDLLIDFGPDTYMHALNNQLDLSAVKNCIITHSHTDHFMPVDLMFRNTEYFAHNLTNKIMHIYGNEKVLEKYDDYFKSPEDSKKNGVELHLLELYKEVQIGDYLITPLRANHANGENAFVFVIKKDNKTILYLNDTGRPFDDFYEYFKNNKIHADLISYDCTFVVLPSCAGHLGLDSIQELREKLTDLGVCNENTKHVITHFSHNGKLIHDELVPEGEKLGLITAYDGFSIEV